MTVKSTHIALPKSLRTTKATGFLGLVLKARSILRERNTLKNLDKHLLEDIGVSSDQAQAEANRPIWDAPSRWVQ